MNNHINSCNDKSLRTSIAVYIKELHSYSQLYKITQIYHYISVGKIILGRVMIKTNYGK